MFVIAGDGFPVQHDSGVFRVKLIHVTRRDVDDNCFARFNEHYTIPILVGWESHFRRNSERP